MADGAKGEDQLVLKGGQRFVTQFGTFVAPNISNDPDHGIGAWSTADLASALMHGVGRGGEHLYPALPYASYNKMTLQDCRPAHLSCHPARGSDAVAAA
jgi:hypothetical protein